MSKRHASGESNLLAQISGVAKALSFEAWALTSVKKNSYSKPLNLVPRALFPGLGGGAPHLLSQGKAPWGRGWKPLCHGFLGHVVIKNKKLLVNDKITALYQTNMTQKHYIKRCKQQKWKTVKLTSFQKPQLQYVSVLFFCWTSLSFPVSFCTCIMYLTTGFNIFFSCFDQLLFSFTQIGGSCHCLKFHNFHDTAPLIK